MPDKVYKYKPFGVNTLRLITEAEAFYAKPSTFNDPLDCDPTIEVDISRSHLESLLYHMLLPRMNDQDARYEIGNLRYLTTEYGDFASDRKVEDYLIRLLARDIKSELDAELGQHGILSLSATWASGLMWSHYAQDHQGLCIEYDTRDQEHLDLKKIDYKGPRAVKTSDLYRWKVRNSDADRTRVFQTYFYTKSREWRYEREWRDRRDKFGVQEVPFRTTAILFGYRCDLSIIKSVAMLLADHPQIKLWQVLPKDEGFGLRRQQIDRREICAQAIREPGFLMFKDIVWDDDMLKDLEDLGPAPALPQED